MTDKVKWHNNGEAINYLKYRHLKDHGLLDENTMYCVEDSNSDNKYKQCLDEIEKMCKLSLHCDNCYEILQKIKEVKELTDSKM